MAQMMEEGWSAGAWGEGEWDARNHQIKFVEILTEYPVLLGKSMVPELKKKRADAIKEIRKRLEDEVGLPMSEGQVWKKLQNMKARVKKKFGKKSPGNRKVWKLKDWERMFIDFLQIESNINEPHDASQENSESSYTEQLYEQAEELDEEIEISTAIKQESDGNSTIDRNNVHFLSETDETKDLSLPELQRLVLLKQLQYYTKAEKLVDLQLRKETQ